MEILRGYTTQATAYEVKDYPYGFRLRTSIFYWIESKAGHGDRFCTYTINPKTGRANAPKCGTYSTFLYMYINDDGHVKCAGIDSYNIEYFRLRFGFIVEKFGEVYLSDEQKKNIRSNHFSHVRATIPYDKAKYTEASLPAYTEWYKATLNHIATCQFKDLVEYPDAPIQDNPEGQIKMFTIERPEPREPELPTHSITAEKVEELLKIALPGFHILVSEWKGSFSYNYLKIVIGAADKDKKVVSIQSVSLSLNLKNLELQPQIYGGEGGQSIYRDINPEDPRERFLAMARIKIPFRRPACNEKDVLAAIERFAVNYKKALIENKDVLKARERINYDELLKQPA